MNRRLITIMAGIIAGFSILVIIVSFLTNINKLSFELSAPLVNNAKFAYFVGDNQIYYFTGTTFMKYTISSGKSEIVVSSQYLPSIVDIKWSQTGAVFKAVDYRPLDTLYPILESRFEDTGSAYWWAVDFKTGVFNLIGKSYVKDEIAVSITDPVWSVSGDKFYYIRHSLHEDSPDTVRIESGSLGSDRAAVVADTSGLSILWSDNKDVIYLDNDMKIYRYGITGKQSKFLAKTSTDDVVVNSGGTTALLLSSAVKTEYDTGKEADGALNLLDLNSAKTTLITKGFIGRQLWNSNNNWVGLSQIIGDKSFASGKDNKSRELVINITDGDAPVAPIIAQHYYKDRIVTIDGNNRLRIAGKDLPKIKTLGVVNPGALSLEGTGSLVDQGISSEQTDGLQTALAEYLSQNGNKSNSASINNYKYLFSTKEEGGRKWNSEFKIVLSDNKTLLATAYFYDLDLLHLYIFDMGGKLVFDSLVVSPLSK